MPHPEWTRYLKEFSAMARVAAPPPGLYCAAETATSVGGLNRLDDDALRSFREDGFVVVAEAFDARAVRDAVDAIGELLTGKIDGYRPQAWGQKHGTHIQLREGQRLDALSLEERLEGLLLARALVSHDARLRALAERPELTRFLEKAMGDAPVMVHDMVRAKPPPEGREKPWHQDLTHFNVHPAETVVSAWVALDDAPIEAGCLHFLPGSHRRGPARHVFERDYQIPDADIPRRGQVAAPVPRGGCVLLNALVHHGSPPNRAPGRRLALQMTFKPKHARTVTDDERIATFAGAGARGDGDGDVAGRELVG